MKQSCIRKDKIKIYYLTTIIVVTVLSVSGQNALAESDSTNLLASLGRVKKCFQYPHRLDSMTCDQTKASAGLAGSCIYVENSPVSSAYFNTVLTLSKYPPNHRDYVELPQHLQSLAQTKNPDKNYTGWIRVTRSRYVKGNGEVVEANGYACLGGVEASIKDQNLASLRRTRYDDPTVYPRRSFFWNQETDFNYPPPARLREISDRAQENFLSAGTCQADERTCIGLARTEGARAKAEFYNDYARSSEELSRKIEVSFERIAAVKHCVGVGNEGKEFSRLCDQSRVKNTRGTRYEQSRSCVFVENQPISSVITRKYWPMVDPLVAENLPKTGEIDFRSKTAEFGGAFYTGWLYVESAAAWKTSNVCSDNHPSADKCPKESKSMSLVRSRAPRGMPCTGGITTLSSNPVVASQ